MDINKIRVFQINKLNKPQCKLKGTKANPNIVEVKIIKSSKKDELTGDVTIEFTMEDSPATKLMGSSGYLQWVGVENAAQGCGIAKILTR